MGNVGHLGEIKMEGTIRPLTAPTYEEQGRPFSSSRKNIHSTHIFAMPFYHTFLDRGSRPGLICMLMLAWLWSAWPHQAQAAQCREQNRYAAGHPFPSQPAPSWPKARSAPRFFRDWPSPQEWRPEAKAFVYTLAFSLAIGLGWAGFLMTFGLGWAGVPGAIFPFLLGIFGGNWLISWVFNRLMGVEQRWQKWLSRGIHLVLLLGLGLVVGYAIGVSSEIVLPIVLMFLGFFAISVAFFNGAKHLQKR